MSRSSESIVDHIADYLQFTPTHNYCCRATSHHHGVINSATICTPRPLHNLALLTGGGGKQQSATTRDAQAPKRKEMRSTQWGLEVEECSMAQLVVALPLAVLSLCHPLVQSLL